MDENFMFPREERIRLSDKGYKKICALVNERDDYRCKLCGSTVGLQHHHVRFRSAYGSDTIDNLILLCASCHSIYAHGRKEKGYQQIFEEYLHGEYCKQFEKAHEKKLNSIYRQYCRKKR